MGNKSEPDALACHVEKRASFMSNSDQSAAQMWEADSVVSILAKMDPEKLPPHERQAVGSCQAQAVEKWLAAYIEFRESGAQLV